jgi:glucose/arabinose dehydrogenase
VRRVLIPLALACAAIAACDEDRGNGASGSTSDGGEQTSAAASAAVRLSKIGSFAQPTYLTAPKGDRKRLFVVEQEGTIRVLVSRKVRSKPFLDISADVNCCGERGLLSMAFAPDYADSGRFYVYFTGQNGDIRVQQFTRSSNPDVADKGSRREVLRIGHSQFPNHNGGQLQTGPDGMLYLGTGDGGGSGDTLRSGQSLGTLLGKLLRIDPRPGGGYAIPADNPFRGQSGARGEIWSYGLRNPYRFTFDRKTGALVIGDVGQNSWDEVDFPAKGGRGANFGWSVFEADERFRSGSAPGHVKPVIRSRLGSSDGNCALIGGYVVRDSSLKALNGRYIWGDNCNPAIYSAKLSTGGASTKRSTGLRVGSLSSFGEDALGRVYATSLNGPVYRLVAK